MLGKPMLATKNDIEPPQPAGILPFLALADGMPMHPLNHRELYGPTILPMKNFEPDLEVLASPSRKKLPSPNHKHIPKGQVETGMPNW